MLAICGRSYVEDPDHSHAPRKIKARKKRYPHIPGANAATGPPNPEPAKCDHT